MLPKIMLIFILFPPIGLASTSIIESISIEGNKVVGTREILGWISTRPSLEHSAEIIDRDIHTIVAAYRKFGFFFAQVDSVVQAYNPDSSFVGITFFVDEGRKTVLGNVHCSGLLRFTEEEILGSFLLRPGDSFDEALFEEDIDALLVNYEEIGYALTSCRIARLETRIGEEMDSIDVYLEIDEGPIVTIDEIRVAGNLETASNVIVRETRVRPGELFDPDKQRSIQQRLQRLNIFSSVSEPELYLNRGNGGLLITVQEGNANTFDGIVGYIPGQTNGESGYVTGLASVAMRNLFGTGRKFNLRWQREDRFSQELGIRYLEPWVLGYPVNLSIGFYQRQQDSTFVRRIIDPKAELMVTEEFAIAGFYRAEDIIPQSGTGGTVLKSSTQTIGGELVYDTRDDLYCPTSGARYGTDYQYGFRNVAHIPDDRPDVQSRTDVQKFGLDLDFYLMTFQRQVIAGGVHGREIRGEGLDDTQMFRFGGSRTLRGYRENQFLGSRIAWSNFEYRFLLARRSFLFGFVDGGYYYVPEDHLNGVPSNDEFKYGYGLGVQVETALGFLGVSYALGQDDTFSTGKIHFGLINEF
jgi:outer membrane protein insertion porin family